MGEGLHWRWPRRTWGVATVPAQLRAQLSSFMKCQLGFWGSEWARMQVSGIFGTVACPSLQVSWFQEREQT